MAAGAWRNRILENAIETASWTDFGNIFSFVTIMQTPLDAFLKWLQKMKLIAEHRVCDKCQHPCTLGVRNDVGDKRAWRCPKKCTRISIRKHSFLEGSSFALQDLLLFIKLYLDNMPLKEIAKQTGMDGKKTCGQWGVYVREIFVEYFHRVIRWVC